MSRTYLVVLGTKEAIRWVLARQRMAFPRTARAEAKEVTLGDQLFLYATRASWSNPGRDRGRIIGFATVTSMIRTLERPVTIGINKYYSDITLNIIGLVPFRGGVELAPLVEELDTFPQPHAWSAYLRRPLLRVAEGDVDNILARLEPMMSSAADALRTYLAH